MVSASNTAAALVNQRTMHGVATTECGYGGAVLPLADPAHAGRLRQCCRRLDVEQA